MWPLPCPISKGRAESIASMLGAKVSAPQAEPAHGVTVVFVELPNTKIELLEPLGENFADQGLPRKESRRAASITSATRWTTSWRRATG